MDGGYRSWTRPMKIENNSPDLDDYGKPLPPPPAGFYWSHLEDGSWEVLEFAKQQPVDDFITVKSSSIIEHVVLPSDTLQGLSLRYGVSAVSLRQLNNFSGSAFRSRKVLRVPVEPGATIRVQASTNDVLLQQFKNSTSESDKEALFYLEEHAWDLQSALAAWSGDESWCKEKQVMAGAASSASAPVYSSSQGEQQREKQQQQQQEEEEEEDKEDTPLLAVPRGVKVVQPLEIVFACAATT